MKETSEPSDIRCVDLNFFRTVRKNFDCTKLAGTAALAVFLASTAFPVQASSKHHHHHHHDYSSSQSSEVASSDTGRRHRHHRHHSEDADNISSPAPRYHHHHHSDSLDGLEASNLGPEHHRRHHRHRDEEADNNSIAPIHHRRRHHSDDNDTVASNPLHHRRRHHVDNEEFADVPSTHESRLAKTNRKEAIAELYHDPSWQAHVARYDTHIANIHHDYELRLAEYEAHEANVREAYTALHCGNVVRAAEAFRGTPYVMGGTSRSGFDCSGFTRYIFGESAGVDLPRTAEEQYYTGQPVAKDDLRAGDLVFFRDTYRRGISHVGMYVGDGRFVHACSPSRGVTVSSLSEQYYINHWAGARRVMASRDSSDL